MLSYFPKSRFYSVSKQYVFSLDSGTFCELETNECLSAPCHNGGTCVDNHSSFYCLCQPDYSGLLCEQELNKCNVFVYLKKTPGLKKKNFLSFLGDSDPCQNNATCIDDSISGLKCHCIPGYSGQFCEQSKYN